MVYLTDNRTTPGSSTCFNSIQLWIVAIKARYQGQKFRTARNTDGRGSDGGVWVVVGCG